MTAKKKNRGILLISLLLTVVAPVKAQDCSSETKCEDCVEIEGCGWAPGLGECMDEGSCQREVHCFDGPFFQEDFCPREHCYRQSSCADCLRADECTWNYSEDLECGPAHTCSPYQNCFLTGHVGDESIDDFCKGLDDTTCLSKTTCMDCLDAGCGWFPRKEGSSACLPETPCGTIKNCFTSNDDVTCDEIDAAFDHDKEICRSAETCKDCYNISESDLTLFDSCKWFLIWSYEDGTRYYTDYCGLECTDPNYYWCNEIATHCPCQPTSSCEECLENGCGYWADDNERRWMEGRCHYWCRDGDYEFNYYDTNCFNFDESLGLSAAQLCADHDVCEGITSCDDCHDKPLESDSSKSCIWIHDSICASRCDSRAGCEPFSEDCYCSSDTPCEECLEEGCGWIIGSASCTDAETVERYDDGVTKDDAEGESLETFCTRLREEYDCQQFYTCQSCYEHTLESDPDRTCVFCPESEHDETVDYGYCAYECDPERSPFTYPPTCQHPMKVLFNTEGVRDIDAGRKHWLFFDDHDIYMKQKWNGNVVIRRGVPGNSRIVWNSGLRMSKSEPKWTRLQKDGEFLTRIGKAPDKSGKTVWKARSSTGVPNGKYFLALINEDKVLAIFKGQPEEHDSEPIWQVETRFA